MQVQDRNQHVLMEACKKGFIHEALLYSITGGYVIGTWLHKRSRAGS